MNVEGVREVMRERVAKSNQAKVADELGVSEGYFSFVLNGFKKPGPAILKGLGIVKVVTYEKAVDAASVKG